MTTTSPADKLPRLTDLQHKTLRSLVNGASMTEIARQEGVTKSAIHRRIQRIGMKLDATSTVEAVAIASRMGLV